MELGCLLFKDQVGVCARDYNIKIILQMDQKQKRISQFFISVKHLPQQSVHSHEINVSSFLVLKQSAQNQNKIELKDNLLLVSTKKHDDFQYTHGLFLDEGLRFQRIFARMSSHADKNKLLGFRLINSQQQYVNIHIAFEGLTQIWLKQLSKHIHEVGFHEVYKTIRKIGKGSTATVFQIARISDGQKFAAKVILKAYLLQKEERAKALAQEISLLRALEHQNIIKLHGVFQSEQALYLIFDRLEGGNMLERLNRQRKFSLNQIRQIMKGIVEGLAYLHKFGIAHRDIKLENIIFKDENSLEPVIADLGLAIFTQDEPYLYYKCGTPGYVAPEIIRMKEHKRIRVGCDIFSAGVIFHILLTNRYLFEGQDQKEVHRLNLTAQINFQSELYSQIDEDALSLLKMMLAIKLSNRIAADEILEHAFLEGWGKEKEEVSPARTETGEAFCI